MTLVPAPAKRLLDFIRGYEAPRGFDTVFGNHMDRMPKPITSMTVDEVIADGPRRTREFGSSAAGGLQFMTATLKGLKTSLRLTGAEVMTPDLQDRLGYALLLGRGYAHFMAGTMSLAAFGNEIAKEWASFPVLTEVNGKRRGQSYYAGDGLNHVLVGPGPVERVLASLRAQPVVSVADADLAGPVTAPQVATVTPAGSSSGSLWARIKTVFGNHSDPAKAVPVLAPTKGDPTVFGVQQQLQAKGYYVRGFVDGLDGPFTRDAVAGARKDLGLGDGGIDSAFLSALPSLQQRAVSVDRASVGVKRAAEHVPAVFSPNFSLAKAGAALIAGGGAGSFFDTANTLAQRASDTADRVSGYMDKAETWGGYLQTGLTFGVAHWQWFAIAGGLYLVFRAVVGIADGVAKVRAAFF